MTKKNIWKNISFDKKKPAVIKTLNKLGKPLKNLTNGKLFVEVYAVQSSDCRICQVCLFFDGRFEFQIERDKRNK